jgi:hypothetical protein
VARIAPDSAEISGRETVSPGARLRVMEGGPVCPVGPRSLRQDLWGGTVSSCNGLGIIHCDYCSGREVVCIRD